MYFAHNRFSPRRSVASFISFNRAAELSSQELFIPQHCSSSAKYYSEFSIQKLFWHACIKCILSSRGQILFRSCFSNVKYFEVEKLVNNKKKNLLSQSWMCVRYENAETRGIGEGVGISVMRKKGRLTCIERACGFMYTCNWGNGSRTA